MDASQMTVLLQQEYAASGLLGVTELLGGPLCYTDRPHTKRGGNGSLWPGTEISAVDLVAGYLPFSSLEREQSRCNNQRQVVAGNCLMPTERQCARLAKLQSVHRALQKAVLPGFQLTQRTGHFLGWFCMPETAEANGHWLHAVQSSQSLPQERSPRFCDNHSQSPESRPGLGLAAFQGRRLNVFVNSLPLGRSADGATDGGTIGQAR